MVAVELVGGLGNQMFQYAAAKALALQRNEELLLDKRFFENYKLHQFSLHHFIIEEKTINEKDLIVNKPTFRQKIKSFFTGIKIFFKYEEEGLNYDDKFVKLPHSNVYLKGYFQSEQYFSQFENEIRTQFQIKTPLQEKTTEMLGLIDSVNSVSLHIRRGDYVTNPDANAVHGTCDLHYYQKAIDIIKSKIHNPIFFIFSDDIAWAKENLDTCTTTFFIDFTNATTNFEDLKMMSHCKNNIIANSSFSWWGAWLNENKNKIVISPEKWFNVDDHNSKDIIPESWLKI